MNKNQKINILKKTSAIILVLLLIIGCRKKDEEKPVISLKGNKEITLNIDEKYEEQGVIAKDNIDGDISKRVEIQIFKENELVETIDSKIPGKYVLTYKVKDSYQNEATPVSRLVVIKKKELETKSDNIAYVKVKKTYALDNIDKNGKVIYSLSKGQRIKIIKEAVDTEKKSWIQFEYEENKTKKSAWIKKESITNKKEDLLNPKFKNLDYTPYEKKEYRNNPKVKVKGIYVTLYSAGGERLNSLIEMTKNTEINTFVIDVKDDNGYLLFPMKSGEKFVPKANKKNTVKDINALMKKLKSNNIYTIARIVSFKDPLYTETYPDRAIVYKDTKKLFTNSDNLAWATAYDRKLWEYNISVAKEAIEAGFNEVQFDYVRFPASNGGKLDKILDYRNTNNESKASVLQEYLKYARKELSPLEAYISADVYGLVSSVEDDMALGQYWESISNVVDYICPMIYPSHYGNGTYGLSIPDAFPYETVYNSSKDAVKRNKFIDTPAIIRPWIQDFTAPWIKGSIKYKDLQVAEQIRALKENGIDEYLLWNASNRYSEGAVKK